MNVLLLLPFAAGLVSVLLALASLLHRRSPAAWFFSGGMVVLGVESTLTGLRLHAASFEQAIYWLELEFIAKSFLPVLWVCFALIYSRRNYRDFLVRWRVALVLVGVLPIALTLGFHERLFQVVQPSAPSAGLWGLGFGAITWTLNLILLVAFVMVLMNLEQTFRSAVGTLRWRIKFVVVALAVIFGARLYGRIHSILFSASDLELWSVESGALLIGCVFLIIAWARTQLDEIDVYPSFAVLRSSLTMLIVGGYLFVVGVLAQIAQRLGEGDIFQFQAIVVLVGMTGLAVLLLSDRARQKLHVFVVRHFSRAQHDSARIWTACSQQMGRIENQAGVCEAAAKLISETFDVLSVTVWLLDADGERLVPAASTARSAGGTSATETAPAAVLDGLRKLSSAPFDLEDASGEWAQELRRLNPTTFARAGNRTCVRLDAGDRILGVLVLADRINGVVYTIEELDLLKCIADHMTSVLLNHRLASEVAQARELEAFRTMSVFFVHDLKNAAASLNLMLKNLRVHFNDPAFREDALRAVANTASRIDEMIARLSALRERSQLAATTADLNQVVNDALDSLPGLAEARLTREFQPLPGVIVDREQIKNVVTNLVLNARDALGLDGRIQVRTEHRDGRVLLSVSDNGCGMAQAFVKESLFRPFQSTKTKGLGIGLFQSRAIVQAHGGAIHVRSEEGRGTTFQVSLPIVSQQ